jgi:hypothetical protein
MVGELSRATFGQAEKKKERGKRKEGMEISLSGEKRGSVLGQGKKLSCLSGLW